MESYSLYMIHLISRMIKSKVDSHMQQFGLTGQQSRIITFIGCRSEKGNVFQRTIEEEFHIRPSSATSMLQTLERNGHVKRESVPEDARLKKLVLTESGRHLWKQIGNVIDTEDRQVLNRLTSEEQAELFRLLKKLTETNREVTND